jgi:hypothetical protein
MSNINLVIKYIKSMEREHTKNFDKWNFLKKLINTNDKKIYYQKEKSGGVR